MLRFAAVINLFLRGRFLALIFTIIQFPGKWESSSSRCTSWGLFFPGLIAGAEALALTDSYAIFYCKHHYYRLQNFYFVLCGYHLPKILIQLHPTHRTLGDENVNGLYSFTYTPWSQFASVSIVLKWFEITVGECHNYQIHLQCPYKLHLLLL